MDKEEGDWMLLLKDGKVHSNRSSSSNPNFEEISETFVAADWKTGMAPGDEIFEDVIRSLVYLPLKVNHELVGMFVAGKSRGRVLFPKIYSPYLPLPINWAACLKHGRSSRSRKNE